jgi:hypothetical protein
MIRRFVQLQEPGGGCCRSLDAEALRRRPAELHEAGTSGTAGRRRNHLCTHAGRGAASRPLYGQAEAIRLGRLDDSVLVEYIASRFETGRAVGEVLVPLLDTARGNPQRAMLLANPLWHETSEGEAATPGR